MTPSKTPTLWYKQSCHYGGTSWAGWEEVVGQTLRFRKRTPGQHPTAAMTTVWHEWQVAQDLSGSVKMASTGKWESLLAVVIKACMLDLKETILLPLLYLKKKLKHVDSSYTVQQLSWSPLSCFKFINFITLTNCINLHTLRHDFSSNNLFSYKFLNFLLGAQGRVEKSLLLHASQKRFYFYNKS